MEYASYALLLGALQGFTEFLPISSSAHLAIAEHFLQVPFGRETMAAFDIFLHAGSLLAILLYFRKDFAVILKDFFRFLATGKWGRDSLIPPLVIGMIPAILAGLTLGRWIQTDSRKIFPIALALIVGGSFFFFAEWRASCKTEGEDHDPRLQLTGAFWIGVAQAFAAVFHGLSRSGATISTGLLLGLPREQAARFSFLLGAVAILAANVYALVGLGVQYIEPLPLSFIMIGAAASFAASLVSIAWLIRFLKTHTLRPFGVYIVLLGVTLLIFWS